MDVGFIGLGNMGQAMARNLCNAGHSVTVYNRTRSRAEELKAHGAMIVDTPADACRGDAVITMLADDRAVEEVVLGESGFLSALTTETLHICMSTISVALSEHLADAHSEVGRIYIAAPVFGRPDAAAAAKLFIIAAGPTEPIKTCQSIFDALGQRTYFVGKDPHWANVVKLSGNFLVAAVIESLGEAFALIRKYGIDPDRYLEILTDTLFSAPVYRTYGGIIAQERYEPPGFKLPLGLKDVRLALLASEETETPMPAASLIHDHLLSAMARGYRELDWAALALVCAENAGLERRQKQ